MTTLRDLRGGDTFRINKVTLGGEIGKRLVDMGLTNGVEGVILRCALLGDPMEIRIRAYNVSLRRSEAAGVEVELLGSSRGRGRGMGRGRARGRHGPGWRGQACGPDVRNSRRGGQSVGGDSTNQGGAGQGPGWYPSGPRNLQELDAADTGESE